MPETPTEARVRSSCEGKPAMVRDETVAGLLVAVGKGFKSYEVQRDLWQGPRGRRMLYGTVRHMLGGIGETILDEARSRVLAVPDRIEHGIGPTARCRPRHGDVDRAPDLRGAWRGHARPVLRGQVRRRHDGPGGPLPALLGRHARHCGPAVRRP